MNLLLDSLAQEQLDELKARHVRVARRMRYGGDPLYNCRTCLSAWPCDAAVLISIIDRSRPAGVRTDLVVQSWVLDEDHAIHTWIDSTQPAPYFAECKCGQFSVSSTNGGARNSLANSHAQEVLGTTGQVLL